MPEITYGAAAVSVKLRLDGAPGLTSVEFGTDGGYTGAGGSGARYMTAPDGTRWVVKAHFLGGQAHRYLCMNEAVSSQIAVRLHVPVPTPGVLELTEAQLRSYSSTASIADRYVFASELIAPAEPLSPTAAAGADPSELAGIAVLDALICNIDRKPEHILAQRENVDEWDVWAIDHGHSFAVSDTVTGLAVDQPTPPPIPMIAPFITMETAEPFIAAAEAIPRSEFAAMVNGLPAPWVLEPDAGETVADVLAGRARQLRERFASVVPAR